LIKQLDENSIDGKPSESSKIQSSKKAKDKDRGGINDSKTQQLNFYQNSEGSSDNL
jgi:hypothetical protein